MHLKRLESVGFKSFAERINVDFVPGVTAVVGPNGSGKSNITDAIRWVLGEQSMKSLRGTKMEDIIFQGSDSRSPLNVAEVTLVLDNKDQRVPLDYEEVSVTRRVYRSGESEFYINKQACRLKDIVDLFIDSGLGREAFSIISQGRVEEILSSKAEERRVIFEEAAGVLKYKQRKKKAEYKLAETQENLNRVEDIVYEIEQQLEPLEKQSKKAKEYQRLQAELQEAEISLLITEMEQIHGEWQRVLESLAVNKKKQEEQSKTIHLIETDLAKEKENVQHDETEIEALQSDLLDVTERLEKLEGKKQLFDERSKHADENKEKLSQQLDRVTSNVRVLEEQRKKEQEKLKQLETEKAATLARKKEIEKKLAMRPEDVANRIEDLKAEYIELLNQQAAYRNEKQSINRQQEQIDAKNASQSMKFKDMLAERNELEDKKASVEDVLQSHQANLEAKRQQLKALKLEMQSERAGYEEAQSKLYQGYQYIEKVKSKKEMLEEMKEDFQGFFQGVRQVLRAREQGKLTNVDGAVIELIDVPKDYIIAIETVLGGQAQHIVVDTDQAARAAINWLKKNNSGRATFLPLQSIQPRFISGEGKQELKNHPGFVGIASELVRPKAKKYEKAVQHLIGNVVIAKTLRDANDIAIKLHRRYRIVTLDGDMVNPGGSMSGGAQKKQNQSLFTREKDLQELRARLAEYQQKTDQFEKGVQQKRDYLRKLEEKISLTEQEVQKIQNDVQESQSNFQAFQAKLTSINDNLSIYDMDKKQNEKSHTELADRNEVLTKELEGISKQLQSVQKEVDELTEEESKLKESRAKLQDTFYEVKVTLAEQEERFKNQQANTKALQTQLERAMHEKKQVHEELETITAIRNQEETEEEIEANIIQARASKQELTESIEKLRHKRKESLDKQHGLEEKLKRAQEQFSITNEHYQKQEVKSNRLDVELENRLQQLEKEYMMTYEMAKRDYSKVENMEEAKVVVSQLKEKINQLGTINLGAIDEYDRISERYQFLKEQRDDLVEGKRTLYTVIEEMDVEMKERFQSTFSKIKEEFSQVFVHLFGGGHAELKLTDPTNLLETGVDIIAQPPGKKLQHLSLLSGGERALTAIALLFSILRVRPVPFCILDEVEAALDEANVIRFAKYVKQFSSETQFIVITHRKGTMEEADVLYGVTMQESGVSRLVSVRLEDTKELIQS
ncbi:chromosome segregation protein SMC [Oceanobacillus sp. J11TS1]|uniref:chromosome segregation protein SMC n=1 Tax=Oceanobacillus sp. J11TS1 TaxID=2807191 RepID=UPI001B2AEEB5|nr:chromosome segregation protein SMC [Oceanobacillus sp. J11TS1]GIO21938.1 chromosome partition protein Smc [Oceanobacillus sp. J11TS1]